MPRKYEWVGFSAAILTIISFFSLVHHNHKLQDTRSLSPHWLFATFIIQLLWFIYAIANDIRPSLVSVPLVILGLFYLSYLKIKLDTNIISDYI